MKTPNGYGSVYKQKGNRRNPWIARVTTGTTDEGKQIRPVVGSFPTKREAMEALAKHKIMPVSPRFGIKMEELYNEWSERKYKQISKSTVDNYTSAWKYMSKYKQTKFSDMRSAHWQNIIDSCSEKLSRSSLEKIKALATLLSEYAVKNDIVAKNYAKYIELPKAETTKKERFSDIEIKKIIDNANSIPYLDTVLILIYTGMRISEMLSLTKFNIDMDKQLITGGLKTDAGKNRIIPIHNKILGYINSWYNKNGKALICDSEGRMIDSGRYRSKMYYPALEAVGVRKLTPHTCRHTFGTLMAEAGADTIYIQKLIGHTDYAFTANEYTHPEIDALRREISKI